MKIYVVALITSKPEFVAEVKNALVELMQETHKEEACIQYDLHQDKEDETRFIFYEIWKDQAGLTKHNGQPHIKKFQAFANGKLQETPLVIKADRV
ncbi:putative quinol monooxygenase [Allomuricauda sp. M10]|jgi:Uncharacterized conserved protein|uniref:putative quinol monooxygenase n=1 Tax=Allomuricauda sp. M10 TaxID=2683292 RepID=UPI001D192D7F|nr:putative quinol monooxygenase [Muricauda sp. M10]